jgi:hypothetical protein
VGAGGRRGYGTRRWAQGAAAATAEAISLGLAALAAICGRPGLGGLHYTYERDA